VFPFINPDLFSVFYPVDTIIIKKLSHQPGILFNLITVKGNLR